MGTVEYIFNGVERVKIKKSLKPLEYSPNSLNKYIYIRNSIEEKEELKQYFKDNFNVEVLFSPHLDYEED